MTKLTALWVWTPLLLVHCGGADPTGGASGGQQPSPGAAAASTASSPGKGKLARQNGYGDFQASCRNINMGYPLGPYGDNVELNAECNDGHGNWIFNTIHLDWILTNNNGYLNWVTDGSYGDFQDSCSVCNACIIATVFGIPLCEPIISNYGPSNDNVLFSCGSDCGNRAGDGCRAIDGSWNGFCQNDGVSLSWCLANYDGNLTYICG